MNFVPIILVRPVCLHLHFSTFSRLSAALASNFLDFTSPYPYCHAKITTLMKFWLDLVSRLSFNLHAIHLLVASSNSKEIDLNH